MRTLLFTLFLTAVPSFAAPPTFQTTPAYALAQPTLTESPLVAGDFNGDGLGDVIVVEGQPQGQISIQMFLGQGTDQFAPLPPQIVFTPTPNVPSNVLLSQAGDFNGDGKLDVLAVINDGDIELPNPTVSVVLLAGNGDGTFTSITLFILNTANAAGSILVADVNNDGHPDIVLPEQICCDATANINTFLGNGHGVFTPGPSSYVNWYASPVALEDINMDGKPDFVYIVGDSVYYGAGDGAGGFDLASPVLMGAAPSGYQLYPQMIELLDLNGDGAPDLAFAYSSGQPADGLTFLNVPGQNAFTPGPNFNFPGYAYSSTIADFNGDGKPDIAYCSPWGDDSEAAVLTILANEGNGQLTQMSTYGTCGELGAGVWNKGPRVSLGMILAGVLTVGVDSGASHFPFSASAQVGDGYGVLINPGDVNLDGKTDIVATFNQSNLYHKLANEVMIRLGNGDGTFQPTSMVRVGQVPLAAATADMNGDGHGDLIVADHTTKSSTAGFIWVVLGQSGGTWAAPVSYPVFGVSNVLQTADLNGDGVPDVIAGSSHSGDYGINVLLGNPNGTLQPAQLTSLKNPVTAIVSGDFHGNGHPDLAVASTQGNVVLLLAGNGTGSFGARVAVSTAQSPTSLVTGDWNADGKPDVAVGYAAGVQVFFGNGDGTFQPPVNYPMPGPVTGLAAADFNLDGTPDLVAVMSSLSSFTILTGIGSGVFSPGALEFADGYSDSVWPANIYDSGYPDLFITQYTRTQWVSLIRNTTK